MRSGAPAPRRSATPEGLRSVGCFRSLECAGRKDRTLRKLRVRFGKTERTTYVPSLLDIISGKVEMRPVVTKTRRKVTHPERAPSAVLEEQARQSASRLAKSLGFAPPVPACVPSKRWYPRRLLIDTGSGDHLASRATTPKAVVDRASTMETALQLMTANGLIEVDSEIDMPVPGLSLVLKALLLDYTPEARSVGRIVEDQEFSF